MFLCRVCLGRLDFDPAGVTIVHAQYQPVGCHPARVGKVEGDKATPVIIGGLGERVPA